MYTSFSIERLRGLSELGLSDLATVNLISGRNNSGKTAILEGIFLHAAGAHAGEFAVSTLNPIRTGLAPNLDLAGNVSPWVSLFYGQDTESPIRLWGNPRSERVVVEMAVPQQHRSFNLASYAQPNQPSASFSLDVIVSRERQGLEHYVQTVASQAVATGTSNIGVVAFQIGAPTYNLDPPAEVLIPAYFTAGRARATHPELARRYSNLKTSGADQVFIDAIRIIEPRLLSVEVLFNAGQPVLHADLGIGRPLPLSLLGEGTLTIADIVTGIFEVRNGVALIDEVENGLHYSVLTKVWNHIGEAADLANVQIFATTHSRECLVAAHNAFRGTPGFVRLLRLTSRKGSSTTDFAATYDDETLESALDLDLDVR